ncbi:hypothetical protein Murru_0024 [Allomuricauda ruestringensis DSM 13258]|uniref:Uncharacterized protein n=1 Tax=Allomuricauda ruestringensis (strain DSM 13258 / CIP 107369 / LMG 19739 / B1) TaxID=886377 RepID=G2PQV0_ALLRU|nr:hypothetical protein [Allomuricauda ruestringensis]AEM69082.1 hypothetical protein Murru_0024 [Allomuricauda ruestringensis DSM 13258]
MKKTIEKTFEWNQMNGYKQKVITLSLVDRFKNKGVIFSEPHMFFILNLGKPKCVFGYEGEEMKYTRIHDDSASEMEKLISKHMMD